MTMVKITDVKKEILESIKDKRLIDKVKEELNILADTTGLENKNNLETFYNIWKKNKKGNKNIINSWTAYALDMTSQKPDGSFLPERRAFARAGFPDIDSDFDDEKRNDIYKYIINKYGRENVGNIGTHGKLHFKSCVTRTVKALDIANVFEKGKDVYITENAKKVDEILKPFPKKGLLKVNDERGSHLIKSVQDAYKYCSDFKFYMVEYPELYKHVQYLEGTFASFGFHAGGICISNVPLAQIAPLRTAKKGMLATQYDSSILEELGLIKFDILAISTFTVIKRIIKLIKDTYDVNIDVENLPLNDASTFALYSAGNLDGVFQCESPPMQETMRNIKVDSFQDIMAAISLFRPGPMQSIPEYCDRKHGRKNIDYFHFSIEKFVKPFLENTYGILIYQEQLMQICNSLAGFSIDEGYVMIKAVGKKKQDLMNQFETQFVNGAMKNNVSQDIAQQYWSKFIVPFASYGFNRGHAAAYAFNSYITCYLKANYTGEFVVTLLSVEAERAHHDKIVEFEKHFSRKLDIVILPVSINDSKTFYTIEKRKDLSIGVRKTEIRPSLLCKGLGINAARNIEENQPYDGIEDIVKKTDPSIVDARVINALCDKGFFKEKKEDILSKFSTIRNDIKMAKKKGVENLDIFK